VNKALKNLEIYSEVGAELFGVMMRIIISEDCLLLFCFQVPKVPVGSFPVSMAKHLKGIKQGMPVLHMVKTLSSLVISLSHPPMHPTHPVSHLYQPMHHMLTLLSTPAT
jgi:hypothetical protein